MPYASLADRNEYRRQWVARRRAEWFADKVCADCGSADDLTIDHVDRSEKVTHRIWSWSPARRDVELAKCLVRCRPCHERKSTVERDRGYKPTKLTTEQVGEIRRRYAAGGITQRALAEEYGVHRTHVTKIIGRASRKIA